MMQQEVKRMCQTTITTAMSTITHGVYIIGVHAQDKYNLMTCAWLSQVSGTPPMLMVAVSKKHYTAALVKASGKFSVSVLTPGQKEIALRCGTVSGRDEDKLSHMDIAFANEELPFVRGAAAYLTCEVTSVYDSSDHYLFVAEVVWGETFSDEGLLYRKKEFF